MKHLAAVALLALGGKAIGNNNFYWNLIKFKLDEKSVTAVIESAGGKADAEKVKKIVEAVKGKDVMEVRKNIIIFLTKL